MSTPGVDILFGCENILLCSMIICMFNEKFNSFDKKPEENKQNLLERLGPLTRKYSLLLALVVPAMTGYAQRSLELDKSMDVVTYKNGAKVVVRFDSGVENELKNQNIYYKQESGTFVLKHDVVSFDDLSSPIDSVRVYQGIKEIPGSKVKITNMKIDVYNNDGSKEHLTIDEGVVVDYNKEEKE